MTTRKYIDSSIAFVRCSNGKICIKSTKMTYICRDPTENSMSAKDKKKSILNTTQKRHQVIASLIGRFDAFSLSGKHCQLEELPTACYHYYQTFKSRMLILCFLLKSKSRTSPKSNCFLPLAIVYKNSSINF